MRVRRLLATAIAAVALAGCGGSGGDADVGTTSADATTSTTTATSSTSPTVAATAEVDPGDPLLSGLELARQQVADPGKREEVDAALAELEVATGIEWSADMLAVLGASYCNDWDRPPGEVGLALTEEGLDDWAAAVGPLLSLTRDQAAAAVRSDAGVDFRVCQ